MKKESLLMKRVKRLSDKVNVLQTKIEQPKTKEIYKFSINLRKFYSVTLNNEDNKLLVTLMQNGENVTFNLLDYGISEENFYKIYSDKVLSSIGRDVILIVDSESSSISFN